MDYYPPTSRRGPRSGIDSLQRRIELFELGERVGDRAALDQGIAEEL